MLNLKDIKQNLQGSVTWPNI